jgi:dihydroneopterin aldolase
MIQTINIEGVKLYAYHGCLPEETTVGGEYIVDVNLEYNFTEAAKSDDLTKTIDYCTVFNICKFEMAIPAKLIEHVCQRIFDSVIKTFPNPPYKFSISMVLDEYLLQRIDFIDLYQS